MSDRAKQYIAGLPEDERAALLEAAKLVRMHAVSIRVPGVEMMAAAAPAPPRVYHPRGPRNQVLNEADVLDILEYSREGMAIGWIAAEYDVEASHIRSILSGKSWSRVTGIKWNPARRVFKYPDVDMVREMRAEGWTIPAIAEHLGVARNSVDVVIRENEIPLASYEVRQRWLSDHPQRKTE